MSSNEKNKDVKKNEDKEKSIEKIWLDSEVQLLKKWGEIAASYRLLHDRAFREYQIKSYGLTIPVIIMSTLSGTASFSISSFPTALQGYMPMVIGGVNIIVGIIQTVTQFLRVNELTESHRVASITYGKFARNITTELSLPPNCRSYNGLDFVQMCRTEMDRLIEQSPIIPMHLLTTFDSNKDYQSITKPEVLTISNIIEYQPTEDEKMIDIIANVAEKIHSHAKVEKTNVQKIQDSIEKKVNPYKDADKEIKDDIKNIITNVDLSEIKNNKDLNIDKITDNIIDKRNTELKEIGKNGVVSKILNKNIEIQPIKTLNLGVVPKIENKE
jgi:hypothetical protein